MKHVSVRVSDETQGVIHPNLFAHNLEHTRACIAGGLSAQMLRNRKFAGKSACASGEAAEWYRIGSRQVYLGLNRFDAYVRHHRKESVRRNEANAQTIQNPIAGQEAGIGQDGLYIKRDVRYEARAVLKGRAQTGIVCTVRMVSGCGRRIYWQEQIPLPQNEWHCARFVFTAPADDMNARFEVVFTDCGEVNVGAVSLMPEANFRGLRPDVIMRLREIGATVLRWPGGNFAGEYRWKDGLMDVDMRAAQRSFREIETHPYTHGFDFHEMNIDDFIAVCREVGAKPYVTINLAWDSPEECAEFVEYCNGSPDSQWGALRASRGYPEPYNVLYWSLGNEFGLGHMEGPNTPEAYTEKAHACAKAMHEKDPRLVLFASGSYNPEFDYEPWLKKSLPGLDDEVEYISYHNYMPRLFEGGIDFVTPEGLQRSYEAITGAPKKCLESLWALRNAMNRGGERERSVKISYDEWNLYFAWYHDPCTIEGLYTGLMLEMLCKNYQELNMPMAMYFQPVNEGAILVSPYGSELTANGQVFALMKGHAGQTLLKSDTACEQVSCLASLDENTGEKLVTLINTAYAEPYALELQANGHLCGAQAYEAKDLLHGSRFEIDNPTFADGLLILPARSIVQFVLK